MYQCDIDKMWLNSKQVPLAGGDNDLQVFCRGMRCGLHALSAFTPRSNAQNPTQLWGNRYNHGPKENVEMGEFENLGMEKNGFKTNL